MVKNLHAPMNALAFGQYAAKTRKQRASKCDGTIAGNLRSPVCVPELLT
jgi:hypothetical protein